MPTILVADDEPTTRLLIRMALEGTANYALLEAEDGRQALACARAEHPPLVLLDLEMPELTGFEVCVALKSDPTTADIRILIITGRGGDDVMGYVFALGADAFLAKPFSPQQLCTLVEELLA